VSRREFAFALVAVASSLGLFGLTMAADTQQPAALRRIGVLLVAHSSDGEVAQKLRQGLRDLGYAEGRDVVIEWRSANGDYDRVPELVSDLIQRKVEVIVVDGTVATRAAKRATSTIPIVMVLVADPVGSGLVESLAHPGGNITGLTIMMTDLSTKQLQLLKEAVPRATRVVVLWNPDTPYSPKIIQELKAAAPSLSMDLKLVAIRTPEEIDSALSAVRRAHAQALFVIEDPLFTTHRPAVIKLASTARLPAIYGARHFADEGGLMSYGANYGDLSRRSAGHVDKILKGAKPGDLPIEQPTKFDLVINLKTAKSLGLTIPQSILLQADEVIR
jgi:putative ABC transport system substrate-binding protein